MTRAKTPEIRKMTSGAFKIGKVSRIFLPVLSFQSQSIERVDRETNRTWMCAQSSLGQCMHGIRPVGQSDR